jgi:NifU-like protein involved in Fe-S cluster formation
MAEPDLNYNETVLDHFRAPRNAGALADANAVGQASNPAMSIKLMLRIENDHIREAHFQTKGCPASIATSSIATELLTGASLADASALSRDTLLDALGGLPKNKHHCPTLVAKAVQAALANFGN